jgi:hypothetical protein
MVFFLIKILSIFIYFYFYYYLLCFYLSIIIIFIIINIIILLSLLLLLLLLLSKIDKFYSLVEKTYCETVGIVYVISNLFKLCLPQNVNAYPCKL